MSFFINFLKEFLRREKYAPDKISKDELVVILIDMQPEFIQYLADGDRKRIIFNQISVINWCSKTDIPLVVLEYGGPD